MKKLFILVLVGVLLLTVNLGQVSAFEWDNVKDYNSETKTVTITNALGLGEKIADLTLKTPLNNKVGLGYQRVAEIEINNVDSYNDALRKMEFYNIKSGMSSIEREFDYKYLTTESYEVNISEEDCNNRFVNGSCGIKYNIEQREREVWTDIGKDLPKGEVTIGIYTNVKQGDYVEWIPTFFGVEIDEWASWEASLNTGLVVYYDLDEGSGTSAYSNGTSNTQTLSDAGMWVTNGKLGTAIKSDGSRTSIGSALTSGTLTSFTISFWRNATGGTNFHTFLGNDDTNTPGSGAFHLSDGDGGSFGMRTGGETGTIGVSGGNLVLGKWQHYVIIVRGNLPVILYVNGTNVENSSTTPDFTGFDNTHPLFLYDNVDVGISANAIDLVGIWNRTLSVTEIENLYNDGRGMEFEKIFLPLISITYPEEIAYSSIAGDLNYTYQNRSETMDRCWYSKDFGSTNSTPTVAAGTNFTGLTTIEGSNTWTVYCNNSVGVGNDTVTFSVDSSDPLINISSPNGTINYHITGQNISLNWSIADDNLDSCWYEYDGVNYTIPDAFCTASNFTSFNVTSSTATTVKFFSNDTIGNVGAVTSTWDYRLFEESSYYVTPTISGGINPFNISFYSPTQITVAYLNYNSTFYLASISSSGNNYIISKSQAAPAVSASTDIPFYWNITTSDGFGYNTNQNNQTVNSIVINSTCTGMSHIYSFDLSDERTRESINGTEFNTSIKVDLTLYDLGRDNSLIHYSSEFSGINPANICIDNNLSSGEEYLMDIQIQYGATNYSKEMYHVENYTLNSATLGQNITLYDLLTTSTQKFRLLVRDTSYLPIEGALIKIDRKYIDNGTYYTTEIPKTDEKGISSASLELNDVTYNFYIYEEGELISSFTNVVAICQTPLVSQCEIDFNAFQTGIDIPDYESGDDFDYTLGYNYTSRVVSTLFEIPSGEPSAVKLVVTKDDITGTSVCTDTLTSSSGTLTCNIPSGIGNTTVMAKIYKDDIEQARGNLKLEQKSSDIYGGALVMISVLVLMTLIGIGISDDPVVTLVFSFVGAVLLFAMNLIQNTGFIGATATILFLFIATILVIIKASRRT